MTASFKASSLALAALALLAAGSAGAAPAKPEKELPPKPSLADVVKASKPAD